MLPWPSDAYGVYSYSGSTTYEPIRLSSSGAVAGSWPRSGMLMDWSRTNHTNNQIRFLPGTLTPWRDPSSYSRKVQREESISQGSYYVGPTKGYYFENGTLDKDDVKNVVAAFGGNPYFNGSSTTGYNSTNSEVKNSKSRALTKALLDLSSAKANMGENLAQLNQTAEGLYDIGRTVWDAYKVYKNLRSGRLPNIAELNTRALKKLITDRKVEKRIANSWLAYWYGLAPLASDAYGLYELLIEQLKPALLVHGRGRSSVNFTKRTTGTTGGFFSPLVEVVDICSIAHECNLTGRIDSLGLVRTLNRMGFLNAPALAWELVPFSFVVDWGVPIGDTLNALTATAGLTFVGGHETVRFERDVLGTVHPSYLRGGVSPMSMLRGFGFERSQLSSFPRPSFYSKSFFTGASRFATIGALLSNMTRT